MFKNEGRSTVGVRMKAAPHIVIRKRDTHTVNNSAFIPSVINRVKKKSEFNQ